MSDVPTALAVTEYLVRELVDDPEAVSVETVDGRRGLTLEVAVGPGDMGRVIGRRGRMANAIRTVVRAAAAKDGQEVDVDFVDDDLLEVGFVTKAHGIRGEVIVRLITDRTERVEAGAVLHSKRGELTVVSSRPHQRDWIVLFEGVPDRNEAETMRGLKLHAEPLDDPDALWVHHLVGATVVDTTGAELGVVAAVEANPASDLLVLQGGGLIPLNFLVSQEPGRVVVDPPAGLLDL